MKLRRPTDFLILEALEERGRNVATNLSFHTEKSRKNINTRLPVLDDYGLVAKIGPAERSGLYEITARGRAAVELRAQYDEVDDWEDRVEDLEETYETEDNPTQPGLARQVPGGL